YFLSTPPHPPRPTLFPYTTLFRSAAARRLDEEDVPRPHRDADLFRLQRARRAAAREQPVAVRQPVRAAEDAVRGMTRAVARGVRHAVFRRVHAQAEHGAHAAAVPAVACRVGAELVPLERQREAHLGHLDRAELDPAHRLALA